MHQGTAWEEVQDTTLNYQPSDAESGRTRLLVTVLGLLTAVAIGAGYWWMNAHRELPNTEARRELPLAVRTGFSAIPVGASWKLTWNKAVVLGMNPTSGTLSIQDGLDQHQVALTLADLASGTVYYSPKSSEPTFHLQIMRDGESVAEDRVRVLEKAETISKNPYFEKALDAAPIRKADENRLSTHSVGQHAKRSTAKTAVTRKFVPPSARSGADPSNTIMDGAPFIVSGNPIPPPVSTSFYAPPPPQPASPTSPAVK
jgi:hypothetical protein